jgi:class 3 adenylate cyclase
LLAVAGAILFSVVAGFAGPVRDEYVVYLPAVAAGLFQFANRRTAILGAGLALAGYVVVVVIGTGYTDPVSRVLLVVSFTIPTAVLMDWSARRVQRLAALERETARQVSELAGQLREMNRVLEDRVSSQVREIETLGRLRRFLSPQVADVVLNSGDSAVLKPHRQKVAVLFCDLRGFTAFASNAEPEEVVEALNGYFALVGGVLQRHNATIGTFAGDGIMAYLNDPVPCEDPAGTAVTMALELRQKLKPFSSTWVNRGHELGFGIGLAYGYATMAVIGFEGRSDYTPLGSVVNLASRLCAEASPGELLIDARTKDAIDTRFETHSRPVTLKGLPGVSSAFQVTGEPAPTS